jgi:hypothetical protein
VSEALLIFGIVLTLALSGIPLLFPWDLRRRNRRAPSALATSRHGIALVQAGAPAVAIAGHVSVVGLVIARPGSRCRVLRDARIADAHGEEQGLDGRADLSSVAILFRRSSLCAKAPPFPPLLPLAVTTRSL